MPDSCTVERCTPEEDKDASDLLAWVHTPATASGVDKDKVPIEHRILYNPERFEETLRRIVERRREETGPPGPSADKITVSVYIDDGTVFEYDLPKRNAWQAREHVSAISATGYRSIRDGVLVHYPPHRIAKIKANGQTTNYPDRVRGT